MSDNVVIRSNMLENSEGVKVVVSNNLINDLLIVFKSGVVNLEVGKSRGINGNTSTATVSKIGHDGAFVEFG
jgi:hypothetical protein